MDSTTSGREYGTVHLGDTNIAYLVVAQGFAKVRCMIFHSIALAIFSYCILCIILIPNAILVDQVKAQGRLKDDNSPYTTELLRLEEKAKDQGSGCWSKVSI